MKKHIAILVAIAMIVTMMPVSAFAKTAITPTLKNAVCKIETKMETKQYTSVEAAIAAVSDGQTITLIDNVESITVDAERKVFTLDLNGHQVGKTNVSGTGLTVTAVKGMTLQNGTVIGDRETGTILLGKGAVILKDVDVKNGNSSAGHAVYNAGATLKIVSGRFMASAYDGSSVICTAKGAKEYSIDVGSTEGEDVNGTGYDWVVAVASNPEVALDGVRYAEVKRAMQDVKSGSEMVLQSNVSTLSVNAKGVDFTLDLNGKTVGGMYITNESDVKIINGIVTSDNIDGSVYISDSNVVIDGVTVTNTSYYPAIYNQSGTLNIVSGTFTAEDTTVNAVETGEGAVSVLDICTVTDPATWESAESFTATVATEPEVILDGEKYASHSRAMQDVKSGSEIVLQKGISTITVDSGDVDFVLNLNGNTVDSIKVDTQGSVKIKNGIIESRTAKNGVVHIISGDVTVEDISIKSENSTLPAIYNQAGTLEIISVDLKGNSVIQPITTREGATTTLGVYTVTNGALNSWFTAIDLSGRTITLDQDAYTYDGTAKTPSVTIDGVGAEYYNVAYKGNTGAGTATVTVSGKYNSNAVLTKTFVIESAAITDMTLSETEYTYDGSAKAPAVTVKSGDKVLSASDYDVTYASGRTNAGTYEVTVTGKGNYTGTVAKTFVINPAKITSATLSATAYTYNGKAKKPTVTVKSGGKVLAASDYAVTYASGRTNAGTYKVTVTGKGNYAGTITKTFKINPVKITSATLSATAYTYNAKAKKPTVTVKAGSLKPATKISADTKNIDLTYASGRKNVGKYKVTIKGKGNYTGTITKTFKINPKGVAISKLKNGKKSLTVTWKKPAATYRNQITGYQIRYSTSSKMTNAKVVKVSSKNATTKTIKKLKAKKKYYVQIRTYRVKSGVTYTSAWSAKKYIKTK